MIVIQIEIQHSFKVAFQILIVFLSQTQVSDVWLFDNRNANISDVDFHWNLVATFQCYQM